jgi:hypothetical protein
VTDLSSGFAISATAHQELSGVFGDCLKILRKLRDQQEDTTKATGNVELKSILDLVSRCCSWYGLVLRVLPADLSTKTDSDNDLMTAAALEQFQSNLLLPFHSDKNELSLFQKSVTSVQCRMLDLFYYTPFSSEQFASTAKQIIRVVCLESVDAEVQAYFLRVLFERLDVYSD